MSDDDFLRIEANDCPMSSCAAPAGSPCRTGRRKVAAQYHTARFRLVPQLAKALSVPVPPLRKPGSAWAELPRPAAAGAVLAGHVRIGYARASTIRQSLNIQTDSLRAAGVTRISPDARDVQPLLALAAALADLRRLDEAEEILNAADSQTLHGIPAQAVLSIPRAARIPVARMGGTVEVRAMVKR